MNSYRFLTACLLCLLVVPPFANAQWAENPTTGALPQRLPDRTIMAGQAGLGPFLTADLVDQNTNAKQHRAVVRIETDGVQIVDPAQANHAPRLDQAHLRYQLDRNTPIDTAATTWTFHKLSPGRHEIHVELAGNDNHTAGQPVTLTLRSH